MDIMNLTLQELDIMLTHCETIVEMYDPCDPEKTKYLVLIVKIVHEMKRLNGLS